MSQEIDSTVPVTAVVLRLLNGALRGGEFVLEGGATLFVLSPPEALQRDAGQADFPDNAIFIPVDDGGGNFEVVVTAAEDGQPQVALRDLSEFAEAAPYALNTVRRIGGGLDIALRAQKDAWSAEVLAYAGDVPAARFEPAITPLQSEAAEHVKKDSGGVRTAVASLLSALFMAAVAAMLWSQYAARPTDEKAAQAAQAAQLSQAAQWSALLQGAVGQYRVLPGRDGLIYIFAADERDAGWARQAVARSGQAEQARVVQTSAEHARILRLLDGNQRGLAYHILRLDNPARPELWLSAERAPHDAAARAALAQRIAALLPYAETVSVQLLSDAVVAQQAAAGLDLLGVRYRKIAHETSVTLSISGALADGELQKIRTFVEAFYRQWGRNYIHFSVEMADDWRKGKSFEYGGNGYVKATPSHWDFSV
ncbi:MAG: PrgH/EprH family type secretion inner rane ring protein [Herbaspirillum sp.]|nr:PrgH/EprH family type secretion inner rane ring protein [Herbaspirillum sp.]